MTDHDAKAEAKHRLAALDEPKSGQWFCHYKGGRYRVLAMSIEESTLEPMVTYESEQYPHEIATTRTLREFTEKVTIKNCETPIDVSCYLEESKMPFSSPGKLEISGEVPRFRRAPEEWRKQPLDYDHPRWQGFRVAVWSLENAGVTTFGELDDWLDQGHDLTTLREIGIVTKGKVLEALEAKKRCPTGS